MKASKSPVTFKTQKTSRKMCNSRTLACGGRESEPVSHSSWGKNNKQNTVRCSLWVMSRLKCYLPTKVKHCPLTELSCTCRYAYAACASA